MTEVAPPTPASQEPVQTTIDPSAANWQHRVLRPEDGSGAISRLEPETIGTSLENQAPQFNVRIERTPIEFSHLYAALERQVAGMGDLTLMTHETLGADRPYVLGITSAVEGEGKTSAAMHLAMTVARHTFKRVCLVDLSLGNGDLAERLGVPATEHGMVSALEDTDNIVPTLQLSGCDNLVVIPAGKAPRNPYKLARSPRVAQMMISARHSFDVVVVDLPSVSTDNALPLARHVDGIVLIARAGVTPTHVVSRAIDILGRDKVIGVALNRIQSAVPSAIQRWLARV
jgi:Mrp family chromosome partitioning ATPase